MNWLKGCDFSFSKPNLQQLWDAGYRVILVYMSNGSKGVSQSYVDSALSIGFKILPLYETTAGAALGGFATGQSHARTAKSIAGGLGVPDGVPIIYALDQDFSTAQMSGPVEEYVKGVRSVGGYPDAYYGGYNQLGWLISHGYHGQHFQTYAWSDGRWLSTAEAPIQQYHNGVSVAGGDVDNCRVSDQITYWETEMPLSADDLANIAKTVWTYKPGWANAPDETPLGLLIDTPTRTWGADVIPVDPTNATNPNWVAKNALADVVNQVRALPSAADIVAAVKLALPPAQSGGLTVADVETACLTALGHLGLTVTP